MPFAKGYDPGVPAEDGVEKVDQFGVDAIERERVGDDAEEGALEVLLEGEGVEGGGLCRRRHFCFQSLLRCRVCARRISGVCRDATRPEPGPAMVCVPKKGRKAGEVR